MEKEQNNNYQGLRPQTLSDFIGQQKLKEQLKIFIDAAKGRSEPLDHVLFYGPPGLGKTTLASLLAKEMGTAFHPTSGPVLTRSGDLASILTSLDEGDILFIDEIHRLTKPVEETLYSAMEDYVLDIVVGKGPSARTLRLKLKKFTVVGATTRIGLISSPMRERFGFVHQIDYYDEESLQRIVLNSAKVLGVEIDQQAAWEIARRSRGTPRTANWLLKRVRDFSQIKKRSKIDFDSAKEALAKLEVDQLGLTRSDRRLLELIITQYGGGPVGLENLAAGLAEDVRTITDFYEPYLMKLGFLERTPRGRVVTAEAKKYLKIGDGIFQEKLVE